MDALLIFSNYPNLTELTITIGSILAVAGAACATLWTGAFSFDTPPVDRHSPGSTATLTLNAINSLRNLAPQLPVAIQPVLTSLLANATSLLQDLANNTANSFQWTEQLSQLHQLLSTFMPALLTTFLKANVLLDRSTDPEHPQVAKLLKQLTLIETRLSHFRNQIQHYHSSQLSLQYESLHQYMEATADPAP